jgi:hypothetical protein
MKFTDGIRLLCNKNAEYTEIKEMHRFHENKKISLTNQIIATKSNGKCQENQDGTYIGAKKFEYTAG